mmetsp:Transcript_2118/g.8252  ORF Transcript_2118/g.8252 Transcript_2118/m.8252 type:complete len:449 (+) Transcript_2118:1997-3343(+)
MGFGMEPMREVSQRVPLGEHDAHRHGLIPFELSAEQEIDRPDMVRAQRAVAATVMPFCEHAAQKPSRLTALPLPSNQLQLGAVVLVLVHGGLGVHAENRRAPPVSERHSEQTRVQIHLPKLHQGVAELSGLPGVARGGLCLRLVAPVRKHRAQEALSISSLPLLYYQIHRGTRRLAPLPVGVLLDSRNCEPPPRPEYFSHQAGVVAPLPLLHHQVHALVCGRFHLPTSALPRLPLPVVGDEGRRAHEIAALPLRQDQLHRRHGAGTPPRDAAGGRGLDGRVTPLEEGDVEQRRGLPKRCCLNDGCSACLDPRPHLSSRALLCQCSPLREHECQQTLSASPIPLLQCQLDGVAGPLLMRFLVAFACRSERHLPPLVEDFSVEADLFAKLPLLDHQHDTLVRPRPSAGLGFCLCPAEPSVQRAHQETLSLPMLPLFDHQRNTAVSLRACS